MAAPMGVASTSAVQKRAKIAPTGYWDRWRGFMRSGKLLKIVAEGTGLEPAYPCGRRFSRPLHYQLCDPSVCGS